MSNHPTPKEDVSNDLRAKQDTELIRHGARLVYEGVQVGNRVEVTKEQVEEGRKEMRLFLALRDLERLADSLGVKEGRGYKVLARVLREFVGGSEGPIDVIYFLNRMGDWIIGKAVPVRWEKANFWQEGWALGKGGEKTVCYQLPLEMVLRQGLVEDAVALMRGFAGPDMCQQVICADGSVVCPGCVAQNQRS